jgi:hypothetical protein
MKTYHKEANTGGITKISLNFFWPFSNKVDRLTKLQNSDFESHFSMSKIVQIFQKKISLKNINLGHKLLL